MSTPRIYLDHAATTPLRPEAREVMLRGFDIWANPSSPHAEGRKARAALEDARERVKAALGWDGEVIFTSGASEALAIALQRARVERRIVSAVEHDAVFRAAPDAEVAAMDGSLVSADSLQELLSTGRPAVVAIQHVNSETGIIQLPGRYAQMVHDAGGLLLSDCSQSAGKHHLPACDLAVVSAHKLGGPIGIGALLVRDFAMLQPSGGHERGYRQGTENLPAALGFAAALENCETGYVRDNAAISDILCEFAEAVWDAGGAIVDGDGTTSMFIRAIAHPEMSAQAQLIRLDAMGFAVSAGSACSSGTLKRSRALDAFGVADDVASRTIRVSVGWNTTPAELNSFAEAWRSLS
ncbi:cysteine desulfurase family protein [Tsuneonella mangrovi]|uniref:cysteine desulfurase family protein n=1 Tax=Tsuneonella mangrovi TaxID=1982042 RepID=UPI000BA25EC6|nr:aminotransferase class V-fold PLP-dependent enzyme [Tsuneonella mangrovi]